jgi:hypothetical protein
MHEAGGGLWSCTVCARRRAPLSRLPTHQRGAEKGRLTIPTLSVTLFPLVIVAKRSSISCSRECMACGLHVRGRRPALPLGEAPRAPQAGHARAAGGGGAHGALRRARPGGAHARRGGPAGRAARGRAGLPAGRGGRARDVRHRHVHAEGAQRCWGRRSRTPVACRTRARSGCRFRVCARRGAACCPGTPSSRGVDPLAVAVRCTKHVRLGDRCASDSHGRWSWTTSFENKYFKRGTAPCASLAPHAEKRTPRRRPQDLSNLLWACAALGVRAPALARAAGRELAAGPAAFGARDLCHVLAAFARMGEAPPAAVAAAVRRMLAVLRAGEHRPSPSSQGVTGGVRGSLSGVCGRATGRAYSASCVRQSVGRLCFHERAPARLAAGRRSRAGAQPRQACPPIATGGACDLAAVQSRAPRQQPAARAAAAPALAPLARLACSAGAPPRA